MNIHLKLNNILYNSLVLYTHELFYIYEEYIYEDFEYIENPNKGVYMIRYPYIYLQPNNICDINILEIKRKYLNYIMVNLNSYKIDINENMYCLINFRRLSLSTTLIKFEFDYEIIFP